MRCPHCSHSQSKVIDSRETVDSIRRRRECSYCDRRYTTYERVQSNSLQVVKRDERREEFSSDKLRVSILKACTKRPLPTGSIDKLVGEIEGDLYALGLSEIPSHTIGESVSGPAPRIRQSRIYTVRKRVQRLSRHTDLPTGDRRPARPGGTGSRSTSSPSSGPTYGSH